MPNPRAFDGYVEQPVRVSATSLIHFQRNRYSVPCEWIHAVVSLRAYADSLLVVGPDGRQVRLERSFERDQTIYDWMHYIALIERKPGALRNGAPFKTMPESHARCSIYLVKAHVAEMRRYRAVVFVVAKFREQEVGLNPQLTLSWRLCLVG